MDTVKLSIEEREQTGNGPARRLRAAGRLPGVVYGKGTESKIHLAGPGRASGRPSRITATT